MQVKQLSQLMQLNMLKSMSSASGYDNKMFEALLESALQNSESQTINNSDVNNSRVIEGIGGLPLQPEKFAQMIELLAMQGLAQPSSEDGNFGDNTSGDMSLLLDTMLKSTLTRDGTQNVKSSLPKAMEQAEDIDNNTGEIDNVIKAASEKYGVDKSLIEAVIRQESSFNPDAISSAGAQGLMQLMPATAKSLGVNNPFNPSENIDFGTRYLKQLLDSFNGNKELALAAYNGGIGRMNRLGVDTVQEISRMPQETQNYVAKVIKNYEKYKNI